MNKEAIERTKARCKKPKYDHVWKGDYSEKISRINLDYIRQTAEHDAILEKSKNRYETLNAGISMITAMNGAFVMSMLSGLYAEDSK